MVDQTNATVCHIVLWIAQGLLATIFITAGLTKVTQPMEVLIESMPWAADLSPGLVKFIGISETLGSLGLILPTLFRIKPFLTVWAAIGLIAIMVLSVIFHIARGEFPSLGFNIVLTGIASFIVWGRVKIAPIRPRQKTRHKH